MFFGHEYLFSAFHGSDVEFQAVYCMVTFKYSTASLMSITIFKGIFIFSSLFIMDLKFSQFWVVDDHAEINEIRHFPFIGGPIS